MARGAATPASWRSGVSGNPAGRPRKGETLREAVLNAVTRDALVAGVLALATGAKDERVRLASWQFLAKYGWPGEALVPESESEFTDEELAEEARIITAETLRALPPEERIKLLADPAPTDTIQ